MIARHLAPLVLVMLAACGGADAARDGVSVTGVPDAPLVFRRNGREVRRVSMRALAAHARPEIVRSDDPYYGRHKRFRALPLAAVLTYAFGERAEALRARSFMLEARDGYAVPVSGARLFEGGAYIAYDDVDIPGFAPIGPQRVSPAPAYLVWTNPGQSNLDTHPRPWQLSAIEIASFEALHPHTVPTGEPADGPAMRGFVVFRDHCVKCHAVNREGGRVGPELNVPQSIVEYRPEAQIRAYIRNPQTFRYGAMPPHPGLSEAEMDALLAYFTAMSTRKHDPDAQAGHP